MSDFLAEARITIRPDTTKFRALLESELRTATAKPIPIAVTPVVVGGLSAATAGTASLIAAQETATASTLGLASAAQVENSALGKQAVILEGVVVATNADAAAAQRAGAAHERAAAGVRSHAVAQGQLQKGTIASLASLTGLRGAVLAASGPFLAGAIGVAAFTKAVQSAASLETELNVFRVTAGATADEMRRVAEESRRLGADITLPAVSAGDAAEAMNQLAKAGLSVQDSLDGARGVLQLATAAQIDNVQATTLVASALNSFALSGKEAVTVADLLTGAANESQGEITDMGLALQQASAVANLAGVSLRDTVTLITLLAQAGIRGSDAGTSLRVALIRLINPTTAAKDALEGLNVQIRDASGNIRPEIFSDLAVALGDLSKKQRDATLAIIFGTDALRAAAIIGREGAQGFRDTRDAVTEQGLAAEQAGARTQGFAGDMEALKNSADALGITLGQTVIPALSVFTRVVTESVTEVNSLASGLKVLISEATRLKSPFLDATPIIEKTGISLGEVVRTGVKIQLLGPILAGTTIAMKLFGDSAEEAAGDMDTFRDANLGAAEAIQRTQQAVEARSAIRGEGLNVKQLLNRVTGFDAEEVRARIQDDQQKLLDVLNSERDFLESQLQRDFVRRRPGLQRQLENALLGVVNELEAASNSSAGAIKSAANDAVRAQQEADQALLGLLSNRRDDLQRKIAAATETQDLRDDIQAQNSLQALIKQQIQKIRDRITEEKARKAAIRELRLALIASRQEEDALRAQQRQDAAARKQEGINLDIDFAEITGNVAREIAARQRLIGLLKKQQANVKKGTAEWKHLRNEIATQQQAIKEARGQAEDNQEDGKSAQRFFFEQLQAQQGFASNLLGNLITGPTAGLVGVPSPTGPGRGIATAAAIQEGKRDGGPSSGQANTQSDILRKILTELRKLNGSYDAPEAINQKKSGSGSMDIAVM